jgi:hypothetical protein
LLQQGRDKKGRPDWNGSSRWPLLQSVYAILEVIKYF